MRTHGLALLVDILRGAKYALIEYQVQWPDRVTGLSFGGCTVISQIGADDLGVNGDNTVYVRTILIKDISSSAYFTEQHSGNATYRGCNVIGIYAQSPFLHVST